MIKVTRTERVVSVEMDRPPVNVVDAALLAELTARLKELAADGSVAAVLLSGAGRCFSAGASVEEHSRELAPGMIAGLREACETLASLPMPVVAMVHGACMGGGAELAMFCDFVVADPGAKLGVPEISLAFFPPFACARLPRLTGRQNAAYLALTGESIDAQAAAGMGLVQKILEKDKWPQVAERFNRTSLPVLRLAKHALARGDEGLDTQIRLFLDRLYAIEDVAEGIASFAQKRRPEWKHR